MSATSWSSALVERGWAEVVTLSAGNDHYDDLRPSSEKASRRRRVVAVSGHPTGIFIAKRLDFSLYAKHARATIDFEPPLHLQNPDALEFSPTETGRTRNHFDAMAVKRLIYYPQDEALLRRKSGRVANLKNKRLKRLIQDLKDTLESQRGAAIAAPQIGVHKRVAIAKFGQNDDAAEEPMLTLINPEIIEAGAPETGFDGCLSIPDIYTWDTPRPSWIRFRAQGEDGGDIIRRLEGLDARVLHHEIDHLDGILFLDRLQDPDELYTPVEGEDGQTKMVRLADLGTRR